jgi:hypothetical protein
MLPRVCGILQGIPLEAHPDVSPPPSITAERRGKLGTDRCTEDGAGLIPHAGTGAVSAASGVHSPLPDRAPDVAVRAAASNIKAPPGHVVAKAKLGRGAGTGLAEKTF